MDYIKELSKINKSNYNKNYLKNNYLERMNNLDKNSILTLEKIINISNQDNEKKNNKMKKVIFLVISIKYILQLIKKISK